ncbi:ABC transporter permease [Streptomyces sp. NPDC049881]|uniref:ABC transporter permease n=1 Tax=Streptomyces sp. NPDC049881 TaxID=3155778 RepID=UPI003440C547
MLFTYLRRELRRRHKAQFVIASGLALGIALVLVVNAVSAGMREAQDDVLESLYGLGTDMTVSKAFDMPEEGEGGGQRQRPGFRFDADQDAEQSSDMLVLEGQDTLTTDDVAAVAGIEDVTGAAGALSLRNIGVNGSFDPGQFMEDDGSGGPPGGGGGEEGGPRIGGGGADFDIDQYRVLGADVTQPGIGPLAGTEVTDGRTFETGETDAAVAVLDAEYAAGEDLAVGDTLTLAGTDLEIIGLNETAEGDAASDVYLPLATAQTLAEQEGKVTDIYVTAADSQRIDAVATAIGERVADADVTTADDVADQVSGSLSTAADLADGVGRWLSWLVLGSSFLVAGLLAASSVGRRVREFGTLKAIGWTRGRVTRQVVGESLVTGLFGGALGLGVGLGAAWLITWTSPGLTAELPATAAGGPGMGMGPGGMGGGPGGMGGRAPDAAEAAGQSLDIGLTAPVGLGIVLLAVTLAVTGGLVSGAFAAWRASRLRPADAFRRIA